MSGNNNRKTLALFWRTGLLIALAVPILAACGGGGGGETASGTSLSQDPSVTTPADGTSSSSIPWTDRLFGQDVPRKMIWNGTSYVGVDGSKGFQVSTDSKVWKVTSSLSRASDIAWDGSTYVAPGSMWFNISTDGKTWTQHLFPEAVQFTRFNSVVKSSSMWVAVGQEGTIMYSTDAANWTVTSTVTIDTPYSGFKPELKAVIWTGTQFVAVGESGVVVTSPDGIAWTVQQSPTSDSFVAIASHGGLIVAATAPYSSSVGVLMTSTDGINWTPRVSPLGLAVNTIVHAGGKWVAAGSYNSMTSTDGETWTEGTGVAGILTSVVHNGTEYVAVGTDGNSFGAVFASNDGLNWTVRNVTSTSTAAAVSPSGRIVAVGNSNSSRTSVDGISWEFGYLDSSPYLDVTWSPKLSSFVALVQVAANEDIYTSADGKTWQVLGNYAPCGYNGATVIASPDIIVNAGASLSGPCLATSVDGVTWQTQMPPWTQSTTKGFWTGNQFIILGTQGLVVTSPDGGTWTSRTSGTTNSLYGGAASPSMTVVVGQAGTILTSADNGVTWTSRSSGTTFTLRRAVWTGSAFYVVGGSAVLRSADGISWSQVATPYSDWSTTYPYMTPPDFREVLLSSSGRVVIFGSEGLVATIP
jgi:hypothetical protein